MIDHVRTIQLMSMDDLKPQGLGGQIAMLMSSRVAVSTVDEHGDLKPIYQCGERTV